MSSAPGYVRASGGNLTAEFIISAGTRHAFTGTVNPAQSFEANDATVTYSSADQVTSASNFTCEVSNGAVKVTLSNGATMQGALKKPVATTSTASGSGSWGEAYKAGSNF